MNVFSGPTSLKDYYDPDRNPPLPLVEIPQHLNPFHEDGVRIYAKMMTMLPAHNVKELPALAMLSAPGAIDANTKTVIEYSSGSTVISMGIVARILHGIDDTKAYISNKTSESKLKMLQFFGLDLHLFGGPSQPEPTDDRGGIQRARRDAANCDETTNPNQYENDLNWNAHRRWTGPQILKQLPSLDILCAGMGTAGTITGTATYMKETKPSVTCLGVCTAPGDRVPGPRSHALLAPVEFPWKACVDQIVECGSKEAYNMSLSLTRNGLVCGPSSGFNLVGLLRYLEKHQQAGTLSSLRNPSTGQIDCVFLCCDLPYQYISEYFDKVPSSEFHPIKNSNLTNVDVHRYDEAWELPVHDAALHRLIENPETILLDLRSDETSREWTPRSQQEQKETNISIPLFTLSANQESPFYNARLLELQWRELDQIFGGPLDARMSGKQVVALCHQGDTARMAASILRAKGVECFSVKGGAQALRSFMGQDEKVDSPMREKAMSDEEYC
ncbi:hypothetical protein Q7P37_000056 [Cladosporium fusiforme]